MAEEDGNGRMHLEEMLTCSVCQDIFKDPRQLPCGHSLCMGCVEKMIDHASDVPFRCPDCRGDFGHIIRVQKSYTLASIAEEFRSNRSRMAQDLQGVCCDYCSDNTPAFKTCLKCEVSMCREHVTPHLELHAFTGHQLVKPLGDLVQRKCPQHEDEVLRYYCRTSGRYICNLCALENKQKNLATETCTIMRRQITEYMDERFRSLQEKITDSTHAVRQLKEEIQNDNRRAGSVNSCFNSVTVVLLCLWFIVLYYAYHYSVENQKLTEAWDTQQKHIHRMYSNIAELMVDYTKTNRKETKPPETQDEGNLMLDLDSVSPFLKVSADLQTVQRVKAKLEYSVSKHRFTDAPQVLSSHCFSSGTHVWEVEAEGYWDIAVTYKSIQRLGKDASAFGNNPKSWSLMHNDKGKLAAYHNRIKTVLSGSLQSNRITVVVSFDKGSIVFSSVDIKTTKLHEFSAELTEPVCLGFGLYRVDPISKASIIRAS